LRLAIIADIHGNAQALEAVLEDIKQFSVDRIIVNGDLVNRGPDNLTVMERLADGNYTLILGNHDDLMRKWIDHDPDLPEAWFTDPFWLGADWCAKQLHEAGWLETLRTLPMTERVRVKDSPDLLISHGSPRHYREGYSQYLADEALSEILQMHPADILIGSHTHQPLERSWGNHLILNTGAVGAPFNGDPRAQYLLAALEGNGWRMTFRQVPYDRREALKVYETSGYLEEAGLSAHIFYEELRRARSYLTPYWMWTEEQDLPRDWETWERYKLAFPKRFSGDALP
jgi:putative phosphoesterase